jgi:stage II sporulation protein P
VTVRILAAGALAPLARALEEPSLAAFLIYMETGRVVRPTEPDLPPETTVPETTEPTQPPATVPCFVPGDTQLVQVRYHADHRPDLKALITQPLRWRLQGEQPTVLILHSHATESYDPDAEGYTQTSPYRTLDTGKNMVSIGACLAELLEQGGIRVIHDTTLHDQPSYNDSYVSSRRGAQEILKENPGIFLVLDLHRDAPGEGSFDTSAAVAGEEAAQLMLVVGTGHPAWEENMALALKLTAQLEKLYPGITRPISFRTQRFNQDLSTGALIVEVGANGNTRQEALQAARALAEGILALANGAN